MIASAAVKTQEQSCSLFLQQMQEVFRDHAEPRQLLQEAATGRAVAVTFVLALTRNSSAKKKKTDN